MQARIYLVEDHTLMREMIGEFLANRDHIVVSGSAATAEQAFIELRDLEVELVLVDTSLPDMSGIDLVRKLLERQPGTRCLMHSGHAEAGYVDRALRVGARGYVVKGNPRELPGAIREVLDGGMYLSRALRNEKSLT